MTSNGTHAKASPQKSNRSTDFSSINEGASTSSPSLHTLPFSKIKAIMASAGSDSLKANDEGLFAMTKATEAFVMMLARGAYEHTQSDNQLTYNSLAEFVQSNEDLVHIHEMVPRKVKFSSIENQLDT